MAYVAKGEFTGVTRVALLSHALSGTLPRILHLRCALFQRFLPLQLFFCRKSRTFEDGFGPITMKEAGEVYGFQSKIVYESQYLFDVTRVEDKLQMMFQNLPLGMLL